MATGNQAVLFTGHWTSTIHETSMELFTCGNQDDEDEKDAEDDSHDDDHR
ncbi:MAG: hypothetical protein OXR68_00155 [Alphaproteobacteria bacterium]|nr:hypothetical protein [Alphaproteobacteria bacterium]MDD9919023.1 hypothetical protein [Alphaproteobacteria bacterium]